MIEFIIEEFETMRCNVPKVPSSLPQIVNSLGKWTSGDQPEVLRTNSSEVISIPRKDRMCFVDDNAVERLAIQTVPIQAIYGANNHIRILHVE